MNATVRKVKLTAAQIIALRSATMHEDGSYELSTAKGQTITALVRAGVVVEGTRFLTIQGVSVMHTVTNVEIIASKGHTVSVSDAPESLGMFTLPARTDAENNAQSVSAQSDECTCFKGAPSPGMRPCLHCGGDNSWCAKHYPAPVIPDGMDTRFMTSEEKADALARVEIQGVEPHAFAPDFSVPEASQCYYGCGDKPVAVFVDYVGRTNGLCEFHMSSVDADLTLHMIQPTQETPVFPTVNVVQAYMGMNGMNHYHAPGCRDIERESRKWNAHEGMGVYSLEFSSVASIITFEYSDVEDGIWSDMLSHANSDFDGIRIMPCLRETGFPNGRTDNGPLVTADNFFREGFDQPTPERVAEIREEIPSTEEFSNERAYKSGTENANDHARDAGFTQYGEEWQNTFRSSYALSMEIQAEEKAQHNVNTCDAFESVSNGYGAVAALSTGAGFHTVTDDDTDAGFVESMITKEYLLSVVVDESTGATVNLGWITLTVNRAHVENDARVAEEYGRVHGTGKPRHGWASIIRVLDMTDQF